MDSPIVISALIAAISLLYSTVGQAGGTAFLAVMAFASFSPSEMRPTSLLLNIVAAGYATWRLHQNGAIDWRMFTRLAVPSLPAAFSGGLLVLDGRPYFILTGLLLLVAAGLLLLKRLGDTAVARPMTAQWTALAGGGIGFLSGITGVGGGVFLAPLLVVLGWASAKRAGALSAPFILANSTLGIAGVYLAGQQLAPGVALYAAAAIFGAALGTTIGVRWMSEWTTRAVLAAILLFAGFQLLLR
jgi:uncharacterized membrane protein YfcA